MSANLRFHTPRRTPAATRRVAVGRRAFVVVYAAVAIVVLFGFMSFAVDWGHLQLAKQELITATTVAARAALLDRSNGAAAAANAAISYGSLNRVDGSPLSIVAGDVTTGIWNATTRTFAANTVEPNAVRVTGVRSAARGSAVQLFFGGLFGVPQRDLSVSVIAINARGVQVTVAPYCNADVMSVDGASFSGGGVDGSGYAMSDTLIAGGVVRGDTAYALLRGTSDAIRCAGQTIPLPLGRYKSVVLFAALGYGPGTNTVTLNYLDGSQTSYAQSFSDWCAPRASIANENLCATQSYRNVSNGTRSGNATALMSYEFPITSTGGVASVTLPTQSKLCILAIGLTPAESIVVK